MKVTGGKVIWLPVFPGRSRDIGLVHASGRLSVHAEADWRWKQNSNDVPMTWTLIQSWRSAKVRELNVEVNDKCKWKGTSTHLGFVWPHASPWKQAKALGSILQPLSPERKTEANAMPAWHRLFLPPDDSCGGKLPLQRVHLFYLVEDGAPRTSDGIPSQGCLIACLAEAA